MRQPVYFYFRRIPAAMFGKYTGIGPVAVSAIQTAASNIPQSHPLKPEEFNP